MNLNRRDFLSRSVSLAGGAAGFSVLVKVDGAAADAAASQPVPVAATDDVYETLAPRNARAGAYQREPHMTLVDLEADLLVAGGGMAGVCAAVAAARHGAKVVLVQDRSRLGGNASSEVKMHIVGANAHGARPGWREGGLIEEFRLDDAVNNPHRSFELWDLMLYDKVKREPNITLLLDTTVFVAEVRRGSIQRVIARCDKTEHLYRVKAAQFLDCTGDCRLGLEAGAEFRMGRESKKEYGESLAYDTADAQTLGSSILFTARDYGRPVPYTAPPWARTVTREMLKFRGVESWEYGYWWIEWGGQFNSIRDNERIRFELLSIVLGVWNYIKNSGAHPSSANWGMDWIGFIPGKRESRRLLGDYVLTQHDLEGKRGEAEDGVAIGGWPMDDHPPSGFDAWTAPPFRSVKLPDVYGIPLRCLYSRNIRNLWMAGRNISATHAAFSSTRVMATCAVIGQAAGTAAAMCVREGLAPRELAGSKDRVSALRQRLLRDDQTIKGLANSDQLDLARKARVTASDLHDLAKPQNVIDGFVRETGTGWTHRWGAKLGEEEAWLQLDWERPVRVREIQLTFDTGFHRELTLSASDSVTRNMVRGPQPETTRSYAILFRKGEAFEQVLSVDNNHQRVSRHRIEERETTAIRILPKATHGDPIARIFEVRVYEAET